MTGLGSGNSVQNSLSSIYDTGAHFTADSIQGELFVSRSHRYTHTKDNVGFQDTHWTYDRASEASHSHSHSRQCGKQSSPDTACHYSDSCNPNPSHTGGSVTAIGLPSPLSPDELTMSYLSPSSATQFHGGGYDDHRAIEGPAFSDTVSCSASSSTGSPPLSSPMSAFEHDQYDGSNYVYDPYAHHAYGYANHITNDDPNCTIMHDYATNTHGYPVPECAPHGWFKEEHTDELAPHPCQYTAPQTFYDESRTPRQLSKPNPLLVNTSDLYRRPRSYVYPQFNSDPAFHSAPPSPVEPLLPVIHAPQPQLVSATGVHPVVADYAAGSDAALAHAHRVLTIPTAPLPAEQRPPVIVEDSPKRPLTLACFFCRKRKIACGSPPPGRKDRTCNQCARRNLKCVYPEASRRGMRPKLLYDKDALATVPTRALAREPSIS
ncbi:hypothetical protein WOLCODRAFT_166519 [Wolfiporia cocos MD-104 SS10]|uniref:Zn(2)-C6 fungal-type domain-containing protein n=1 Tax=Wolfiporia cocos (strain MD-104) TaxID=742152 RepID=A0A2H3J2C9_WOLCO|nr:hypothetical protein WOLCODRAFT_166519 [Wolfiporia cocos MD-104 SS10]